MSFDGRLRPFAFVGAIVGIGISDPANLAFELPIEACRMYTEAILIGQNLIKFQPAVGCIRRRVIKEGVVSPVSCRDPCGKNAT